MISNEHYQIISKFRSTFCKLNRTELTQNCRGHNTDSLMFMCAIASTCLQKYLAHYNIRSVVVEGHFSEAPSYNQHSNHAFLLLEHSFVDITAKQYDSRGRYFPEINIVPILDQTQYTANRYNASFENWPLDQQPLPELVDALVTAILRTHRKGHLLELC
jgi:hypothetical protein